MKNKEANFQILKIAAMLMIVSHHLVAKNAFNIDTQVIGMGITYENHKSECKALILIPYIVAVISIIVLDLIGKKITSAAEYSCYFMRGNYRPVSMMVSIGLFMWGTSWKARTNKVIDYLAEATFGVYLFHMYPANMTYLFEKLFSLQRVIEKPYAVLWVVAVTAIIFVVGVAIDSLRKAMFYSCEFLTNWIRAKNNSVCS